MVVTPTEIKPHLSFDQVLVTDGMAQTIFGLGHQERLLYAAPGVDFSHRTPSRRDRQAALSLIVLFDKLIIHDLSPGDGSFRLPDLERDGVCEIVATDGPRITPAPSRSSWQPSTTDPRKRPPASLRRSLGLMQVFKPLVIDRLLSVRQDFPAFMARTLDITKRKFYGEFLDLAISYALGDGGRLSLNIIEQRLPPDLLNEIKRELFDFQIHGDKLSATNAILVAALAFAHELAAIRELSASRGLGVATRHYTRGGNSPDEGFSTDPSQVPRSFGLVRGVLHEEGQFFPEIHNIAHALKLRKDRHLRAFKEQFREFHEQLACGDRDRVEEVRKEVRRAKKVLERMAKWNLALRWVTYLSLPAGLVESLLGGAPILGTSLAVLSTAGTAISTRASRKSEWVLFGM